MRRLALLALLVPLVAGCAFFGPTVTQVERTPAPGFDVPAWVKRENLPPQAIPGATLFAAAGCTACHTYLGSGASELGAPDLTTIGRRRLGIAFEIRHLKCPSCVNPGSPMPRFSQLGKKRLRELAIFLEASKGRH